jgi:hypothetical protein
VWYRHTTLTARSGPGVLIAECTELMDLTSWPQGMRVIGRTERPQSGAHLRITDVDGNRVTAFATNSTRGQLADLELCHRRRARCEDRIRIAKDTGLRNPPLHDFAQKCCSPIGANCSRHPTRQSQTSRHCNRRPSERIGGIVASLIRKHLQRPPGRSAVSSPADAKDPGLVMNYAWTMPILRL